MIDLVLLQTIKRREEFEEFRPMIRDYLLSDESMKLVRDFEAYFKKHQDQTEIDWGLFPTYFKQVRHPNMKQDELQLFEKMFDRIQEEPQESSKNAIKAQLLDQDLATIAVNKGHDVIDGRMDGDMFIDQLEERIDYTKDKKAQYAGVIWDDADITEVAESLSYDSGIKFGLSCLDESCGSLHPSKFIIVGAYVDTGKSTFLADQFVARMLEQVVDEKNEGKWFYNKPILWFNNEGSTKDIKMYCVQSFFGAPYERVIANPVKAQEEFEKRIKDPNMLRVIPCQGWHINDIEKVIKRMDPAIVIYDMLDNVRGYENTGTTDQRYRELYDHARQMATKYEHVAVGTSQASGEANGLERIEMHMLYGCRTAKQSTADLMIMLGRSLEASKYNSRFIYTPKNKLQALPNKAGVDRYTNTEVRFDGETKRFLDPIKSEEN